MRDAVVLNLMESSFAASLNGSDETLRLEPHAEWERMWRFLAPRWRNK